MINVSELAFSYQGHGSDRSSSFGMRVDEFTVPAGASTALVGPSGSGKTTLLGLIAGTLRAVSGDADEQRLNLEMHAIPRQALRTILQYSI